MYVCPDCKTPLVNLYCSACRHQYQAIDGVPVLVSNDPRFQEAASSIAAYNAIYRSQTNVWENQGRTPEFLEYFSSLLQRFPATRYLEVGCGEGFLFARVKAGEKFAVDLSVQALKSAQAKTQAQFSVALAERLPFASADFDLVASVGVMEHFLDDLGAAQEIRRVLRDGGYYVALLHVELTLWERIGLNISRYLLPYPKPLELARRLKQKLHERGNPEPTPAYPEQPIQRKYSTRSAKAVLERGGFKVVEVIHTRKYPELPLKANYVVIYVAKK
jgi:SAM-dependent methyltransferase